MNQEWSILIMATVLGLSGGLAPGPLLTLTITETLQHSWKAGFKVAFTPVITDTPLILILWPLLHWASDLDYFFGVISLGGASFLMYLAYHGWIARAPEMDETETKPQTFRKAALTNLLNPAPYLFWLMVGIPLMIRGLDHHWSLPFAVYCLFFGLFVITKCLVALVVERLRHALQGRTYLILTRALSLSLAIFALMLLRDAAEFFTWFGFGQS